MRIFFGSLFVVLCAAGAIQAQERPRAFVGARLIPIAVSEIASGTLVVHKGKIIAIGAKDAVKIPENAEQIDVSDKVIMPGLICTHSHVGGGWGGDSSSPIHPDCRILDSINVRDAGLQKAQAGGADDAECDAGVGAPFERADDLCETEGWPDD